MRPLKRFLARLLNSALRRRDDKRLQEEIEEHLALQTADHLRAGLSSSEARRQALLKFGAVKAIQDYRFGWRSLRKSPGFTAVAVVTLALGIGASTAIFSTVDRLMIRALPVQHPLDLTFPRVPQRPDAFRPSILQPRIPELRNQTRAVFSDVNAVILGGLSGSANLADGLTVNGVTRPAQTFFAGGEFFQMLDIRPVAYP